MTAQPVGEGTATTKNQDEKLVGFTPRKRRGRKPQTVTLPAEGLVFDRDDEPVAYDAAVATLAQLDGGAK